jgi:hypothetical protein
LYKQVSLNFFSEDILALNVLASFFSFGLQPRFISPDDNHVPHARSVDASGQLQLDLAGLARAGNEHQVAG